MGSPAFFSIIVDKLLARGIEELNPVQICNLAKCLKKATNVQKAGFGFHTEMEKHFKTELHQGRINFAELANITATLLESNIGSNEFHLELEKFILANFSEENLMNVVNMIKGMSLYTIKSPELEDLLFKFVADNLGVFSIKQLESLLWSFSRGHLAHWQESEGVKSSIKDFKPEHQVVILALCHQVMQKSASMRPRGVAFAIESLCQLQIESKELYDRMERVTLAKLDDFNIHYIVKVLMSFSKMNAGSSDLYDQLINKVLMAVQGEKGSVKYSDLVRFFEVFPDVTYIYENSMNTEIYQHFVETVFPLLKDSKFPTEDVCRVFSIMVRISPFHDYSDTTADSPEQKKIRLRNNALLGELIGRLRHSVFDVPKHQFAKTMANLIEFQ
jgi:hypothetical protein